MSNFKSEALPDARLVSDVRYDLNRGWRIDVLVTFNVGGFRVHAPVDYEPFSKIYATREEALAALDGWIEFCEQEAAA